MFYQRKWITREHWWKSSQDVQIPKVGMQVRIRHSGNNPLAGQTGTIIEVSSGDPYGTYLVEFEGGLRFRYEATELSVSTCPGVVQESLRGFGI